MNYIVFDLEFNQAFSFGREHSKPSNPRCPFEIINIGAVKLDKDLNHMDSFDRLVKPRLYTRIHPYVKKMTGITRESLKAAQPFIHVYDEFTKFIDDEDILCVWGISDIKELLRNTEFYKMDTFHIPKKFIDVQHYANKYLKHPKGNSVSLAGAAQMLNIPVNLKLHNAYNDAFYTSEVFKKIFDKHMKIETLQHNKERKPARNTRKPHDTDRLIEQFKKMFHREMTYDEQEIIKLAYKLGNKNQFNK